MMATGPLSGCSQAHARSAHEILGVASDASKKEIKRAYLEAALKLGEGRYSVP